MDSASEKQRSAAGPREQRRADLALVTSYHEAQLAKLLERVQAGLRRFEAGEISAFEVDDVIHHYKRAAGELWKFCGDLSGSRVRSTARTLEELGEDADSIDWWERGNLDHRWAYGAIYGTSTERTRALPGWLTHYNFTRRHGSLGHRPPAARLAELEQRGG